MIYTFRVELVLVLEHRCVTKHYVIIQCSIMLVLEHHCVAKHYVIIQCSIMLVIEHHCVAKHYVIIQCSHYVSNRTSLSSKTLSKYSA